MHDRSLLGLTLKHRKLEEHKCRSQWPRCLRRRSAAARLLRLWVRIPPGAWMSIYCVICCQVGLCDGLITRPEENYRLWCVVVWSRNLVNVEALLHCGLLRQKQTEEHQWCYFSYKVSCLRHTVRRIIVRSLVSAPIVRSLVSSPHSTWYHRKKSRVCGTQYVVSS